MKETPIQRRITFQGRVQGVGFRATCRHLARHVPVRGWVRNDPDGSVLMVVQGGPEAVDELLAAIRAHFGRLITSVDIVAVPAEDDLPTGFEIRR